jgi:carbon starvation protein
MMFVMVITVWALAVQVRHAFAGLQSGAQLGTAFMNGIVGLLLLGLAIALMIEAILVLSGRRPSPALNTARIDATR